MSNPFPRMLPGSLTKKAEAENSRQYKADGYDLLVTSRANGAPRPRKGERATQGRKAGVAACGR
ncbi:MAG: hypothetical protein IJ428_01290 [Clostridia bacterium]|nr:hypothetical protein [Clostridia bacterium]